MPSNARNHQGHASIIGTVCRVIVALGLAIALLNWAIDSGQLWQYGLATISVIYGCRIIWMAISRKQQHVTRKPKAKKA